MTALITLLTERFKAEQKKSDLSGIYALTQRMLAYNSNRIEGSTLTEKQTASLFETGTIIADGDIIRAKDVEEMTGHFSLFTEMLQTYEEPLTQKLIKSYHFRLKSGVFEDVANGYPVGEYKNRRNIVSDIETALPEEVFGLMENLLQKYNQISVCSLFDLAQFHADFERIHPFQDGNGRVGRMILFKECLRNRIIPFVIDDQNKAEYYHALNTAQNQGGLDMLVSLFESEQVKYEKIVKDFVLPSFSE